MWSVADIADALAHGIEMEESRLREEQAVYGLDALDEVALHPVIECLFRTAGYGVFREQRYPADRKRPRESEGERCDFVLTPDERDLRQPDKAGTLFDPADAVPLDEAFWLEVKTARQYTIEGPNPRYASEMLSISRRDVAKLSKDRAILHAGLMMIAFIEDERIARHDLGIWYDRCIDRGLPIGYPSMRLVTITNRHGHGICGVSLAPVSHL